MVNSSLNHFCQGSHLSSGNLSLRRKSLIKIGSPSDFLVWGQKSINNRNKNMYGVSSLNQYKVISNFISLKSISNRKYALYLLLNKRIVTFLHARSAQ